MANERIIEYIVKDIFEKNKILNNGEIVTIYPQKPDIPKIQKLLMNASKSGIGEGKPEFIVVYPSPFSDFLIVVECKDDSKKHESKERNQYKNYAVDGVLLYSSFLSKEFDVLSIAVSGQNEKDLKVSNFLQLKKQYNAKELNTKEILTFDDYLNLYINDTDKEKISLAEVLKYSKKLNDYLRSIDLTESHRPLLVSGILIALEDSAFSNSYKSETRPKDLSKNLEETIIKVLDKNNIPDNKKANMKQAYSFIQVHSKLSSEDNKNTILRDLIEDIEKNVKDFNKTYSYYDVLGKFYQEFLRYANGDKSLGIVLTPLHITELFVELANINETSILLDNCCGTGGFLISAMKKMISLCNGNKEKEQEVKEKRLIGIESNSNMFSLACSNMLIRGDGNSNIYYGSCFDKIPEIKYKHKPNVGFLNPPYSKKDKQELEFVLNNLEYLEPNSLCIAIVPISCAIEDPFKEKILDKHTLEAVMSMPESLFHDSKAGTVTCVMIIKAHIPHKQSNIKTWFGYWRDDGFIKIKNEGRVDKNNTWHKIKEDWLVAYRSKDMKNGILRDVTFNDEWCAEAYMETDYTKIQKEDFEKSIKEYLVYKMLNEEETIEEEE